MPEVSCAFLLGVITLPYAWQTVHCAGVCARVAETWGRLCPGCPGQSIPFKSIQGYGGCRYSLQGFVCRSAGCPITTALSV